jgi:hypothetical protein
MMMMVIIVLLLPLMVMMMSSIKRYFSLSCFLSLESTGHTVSSPVSHANTVIKIAFSYR